MKKQLLALVIMACLSAGSYSQPTNIYQPNGAATIFRAITYESLIRFVSADNISYFCGINSHGGTKSVFATDGTVAGTKPIQTLSTGYQWAGSSSPNSRG